MKTLISPVSLQEAEIVAHSHADIIDIKNVKEGSLGAQLPLLTRKIVQMARPYGKICSATLGDLPYKPGTAALAALGLLSCGVDYIKGGLFGPKTHLEALEMIRAIVETVKTINPDIKIVASGYADWRKIDGLPPDELITAAAEGGADVVMVDTAIKDGSTLFDNMSYEEVREFIHKARKNHLMVALAGSLKESHLPELAALEPDIIGVRGAVCARGDRHSGITGEALSLFLETVQKINAHRTH